MSARSLVAGNRLGLALVRGLLAATFAVGVGLHATALVAGRGWLLEHLLTPTLDVALIAPMAVGGWGLWHLRDAVEHPYRAHRAVQMVIAAYMVLSAIVHLETLVVWEVRYVARFPGWYSAIIIPVQAAMLAFVVRLRARGPSPV